MSISTAISRVTGFIRIGAMAYALGATFFAAQYIAANNIPNMIYELVAGGVLSSMFIPIFLEQLTLEGDESASHLASTIFNVGMIALAFVALVATLLPYPFIRSQMLTVPPAALADGIFLFRFFAVQVVFYGAAVIMTGMLNSKRHFLAPAIGPVFNNVVVIITLLAVYVPLHNAGQGYWAKVGLAVGTTLGVVAQMATCLPPLLKLGFKYFFEINLKLPAVRKMGRKMIPLFGYVAVNLIGVTLRNTFATAASSGGIATLNYAWVFYQLPYGILAVALATAVFPEISEDANRKDWAAYREQFARGLRANALLILPAAAMLIALSTPLITLWALTHGKFNMGDVPITAAVLSIWALGLFSFTSYMFTVRGFYSLQDTRTPATTNAFLTILQVGLYALLTVGALGWTGIGLVGIPTADAIFFSLHFVLLLYLLRRRVGGFDVRGIASSVSRVILASAVGGVIAWGIVRITPQLSVGIGVVAQLLVAGVTGLMVSFGLAALMRVRELEIAAQMARRMAGRLLPGSRT